MKRKQITVSYWIFGIGLLILSLPGLITYASYHVFGVLAGFFLGLGTMEIAVSSTKEK